MYMSFPSGALTISSYGSKGRLPILKGTILFDFDSLPLILAIPLFMETQGVPR